MANKRLTVTAIAAALRDAIDDERDVWLSDDSSTRGDGRLQLRARPSKGHPWYWRYTRPDGTTARILLGAYSGTPTRGALTLAQARTAATDMATLYHAPRTRDVGAHLRREAAEAAAAKEAANRDHLAALAQASLAETYTLSALTKVYVGHLRKVGKRSALDAENIFSNHVIKAHPTIALAPANAVPARDIVIMLRALTEAGKGRTAAKLRSYLRAAYALAARAALDSDAPAAFLPFNVESNPVQATAALSQYNRTLDRTLSDPELREYWAALQAAPDSPARDALLLLLLLGGQRPTQLVRATVADVDLHAKTLRLHDPKGKRAQPRVHTLPLSKAAASIVERCLARAEKQKARTEKQKSVWLFSTHGKVPLRGETLTEATRDIAAALLTKPKAQRIMREPFQLRDLRRTAETAMARMGVSKDVRAQIQSHGLGGIQARHYDRHDYMPEKTAALVAWAKYLETASADKVVHIRERRTRRGRR